MRPPSHPIQWLLIPSDHDYVQIKYRRPPTDLCIFISKFIHPAGPPFASRVSLPPFCIESCVGFFFTVSMTITTWPTCLFRGFCSIFQMLEFERKTSDIWLLVITVRVSAAGLGFVG
jgi:hypothetical protein